MNIDRKDSAPLSQPISRGRWFDFGLEDAHGLEGQFVFRHLTGGNLLFASDVGPVLPDGGEVEVEPFGGVLAMVK